MSGLNKGDTGEKSEVFAEKAHLVPRDRTRYFQT